MSALSLEVHTVTGLGWAWASEGHSYPLDPHWQLTSIYPKKRATGTNWSNWGRMNDSFAPSHEANPLLAHPHNAASKTMTNSLHSTRYMQTVNFTWVIYNVIFDNTTVHFVVGKCCCNIIWQYRHVTCIFLTKHSDTILTLFWFPRTIVNSRLPYMNLWSVK